MGGLKVVPSTVVWTRLTSKTIEAAHCVQKGKGGGNSAETQRHSVGDGGRAPLPQPCSLFQTACQDAVLSCSSHYHLFLRTSSGSEGGGVGYQVEVVGKPGGCICREL